MDREINTLPAEYLHRRVAEKKARMKDKPPATDPPRAKQSTTGDPWADVREGMRAKCEAIAREVAKKVTSKLGEDAASQIADAISALKDKP